MHSNPLESKGHPGIYASNHPLSKVFTPFYIAKNVTQYKSDGDLTFHPSPPKTPKVVITNSH